MNSAWQLLSHSSTCLQCSSSASNLTQKQKKIQIRMQDSHNAREHWKVLSLAFIILLSHCKLGHLVLIWECVSSHGRGRYWDGKGETLLGELACLLGIGILSKAIVNSTGFKGTWILHLNTCSKMICTLVLKIEYPRPKQDAFALSLPAN